MQNSEQFTVAAIGWSRIALGVALVLAPRRTLRMTFVGRDPSPLAVALTRGFGARDVAVGAGVVWAHQAGDPGTKRRWLLAAAACDAVDALAMLTARGVPGAGRAAWVATASSAAATGVAAALQTADA